MKKKEKGQIHSSPTVLFTAVWKSLHAQINATGEQLLNLWRFTPVENKIMPLTKNNEKIHFICASWK